MVGRSTAGPITPQAAPVRSARRSIAIGRAARVSAVSRSRKGSARVRAAIGTGNSVPRMAARRAQTDGAAQSPATPRMPLHVWSTRGVAGGRQAFAQVPFKRTMVNAGVVPEAWNEDAK